MTDEADLIQLAERLLSDAAGHSARLSRPEKLSDENIVLRCQLDVPLADFPPSVILKQIKTMRFNNPDRPSAESHRFLNEWASLAFLGELSEGEHYGPSLLVGDRAHNLIVLEDFGEHATILDLLLDPEMGDEAQKGLEEIGRFLGKMQAAAYGREAQFEAAQSRLDAATPLSDSTIDFRQRTASFEACFAALKFEPAVGFWDELEQVERSMHESPLFRSFIHADAGPHNFLVIDGRVQLLDYEFGAFHHGLLDVVSARLGFPHTGKMQTVPAVFAERLERAYQREMMAVIPQISDQTFFEKALVEACAHWTLSRWFGIWTHYFHELFDSGDEAMMNEKMGFTAAEAQVVRARVMTLYQSFICFAQQTDHCLCIMETMSSYVQALQKRWPELDVMPVYPALQRDRL